MDDGWTKKLTADERTHLRQVLSGNRLDRELVIMLMRAHERIRKDGAEPCFRCKLIGRKLGIIQ